MLSTVRRCAARNLAMVLLGAAALVALPTAAMADDPPVSCTPPAVAQWRDDGTFICRVPGGTTTPEPEGPGGGGSSVPTCDLAAAPPPQAHIEDEVLSGPYCSGTQFCVTTELVIPYAGAQGERPNEDSETRHRFCSSGGTYTLVETWWSDDEEEGPTLIERALSAVGQIDLATPTLGTSPAVRTLVGLDTWFWAGGAAPSASGSAFDLVATATFSSMTVTPGDGSAAFSCPLTTTAAAAATSCRHEYRRASNGGSATVGGRPAFRASVALVYDLVFTIGGNEVTVPGAPATLEAPVSSTDLRVDEVQSIVTEVR